MADKDEILVSSGFPAATLEALRRRWDVIAIDDAAEALSYLQQARRLPRAVVIGMVRDSWPQTEVTDDLGLPAHRMLEEIHRLDRELPVIVSTSRQNPAAIVEMVKRGCFDYVVEVHQQEAGQVAEYTQNLLFALGRAVQWRSTTLENRQLKADAQAAEVPLLARAPRMLQVLDLARKVAATPATVLITGESGVGKELVARTIHALSAQGERKFVPINCGALSEPLLNSELFGHVRGAFTGADSARQGLIREAANGTLFLDEIATVSEPFQVTLLRVLEARRSRPVGGQSEYDVHCRFIAAANRSLSQLVREGRFREDLFYRLNVFHLRVPPLRERPEDIAVLAQHFLQETVQRFEREISGFEPAAMQWLEQQPWPGNVRQLRNLVERAVILCEGDRLRLNDLATDSDGLSRPIAGAGYDQAMHSFEAGLLRQALDEAAGNVSAAARQLDMKRTTLTSRLQRLGLR